MDKRKIKISMVKAGGNAGKGAYSYRVSFPSAWAKAWSVTREDRDVAMAFDGERVVIERVKKVYRVDRKELLDAIQEYEAKLKIGFDQGEAYFYSLEDSPEETCEQVQVIDDQELLEMDDEEVITFLQDSFDVLPSECGYQVKIK